MSKKIGALWIRKSNDGSKTFLSGVLEDIGGEIQITVFKNDRKEKDNQPDYNIVRSEKRDEQKTTKNDDFLSESSSEPEEKEVKVEDIPF